MISKKEVKRYCREFEEIENYQEAVSSPERWDCHHRNEIDMNLSRQELIKLELYYNRPASELIFLTQGDHTKIHKMGNKHGIGNKSMSGRRHSEESKRKISDTRKYLFDQKGYENPMLGRRHSEESKRKMSDAHTKDICPALLRIMYMDQKKSVYQIAKEFGCGYNTIKRHLLFENKED